MKVKKGQSNDTNVAAKYQDVEQCTTVMIRNIPRPYTQTEMLREVVEVLGSPDVLDFFYLPWDFHSNCNMTYAFVNFLNISVTQQAVRLFTNYKFRTHEAQKAGQVVPAHVQGLQNNLRHLQHRAVTHSNHSCSPIVMCKGRKIELSRLSQDVLRKLRELHENGRGGFLDDAVGSSQADQTRSDNTTDSSIALLLDKAADVCTAEPGQDDPGQEQPMPSHGLGSQIQGSAVHVPNSATRDAGQAKGSCLTEKYQAVEGCTTIMIRNIPCAYTQDELLLEVDRVMGGSADMFDFFYLPWDFQVNGNTGYAFVNFRDRSKAQMAVKLFTNYRFERREGRRRAQVLPAHIQGLRNNLMRLQDRAVADGSHPCSPVVMWKGRKIELSKISQQLRTRDALRKFRAPMFAGLADRGGSLDDSVIPSNFRDDMAGGYTRRLPPASQPSSRAQHAEVRSAEEFDEILDRVAGIGVGDGGIGLPLSTPVPIPGGARNASRNSTVMGKSRGKVGHPGMADNTGMSVNPGVAGKPGVAGNFNMVSFGGIGGLDCRVLGAELTAGGPKNRTAHEFFEEDEAAAPLSALASDNSTGLVPSFMMFASITGCGTVTDGCGRGKMQSPASAPPAGSRQLAALGYPHMGSGPVRSGSGGVPTVSTPPGFRHGSRMQTAERGWPVTSPGSHGSQQQQQQQFPCDSNRRQGSLPLGSSQGHPQNKGHPQQSSVDTRGWTMLGTHSGSSVGQLQRAYHAAGKQSELVYPPGSSAEATFANHQPMPDGNCQSASATPPGLQRGHQLPFDATPTPTFEFLCSVEGASALGSNVPGGPLNDVAVKYDPPALPQVMPSFASLPPSGTTAPGLAADESPKPYHDTSVQPLAAGGGTAALGRVCSQQPPSPALPSTYRSASSLSMSLPAASTSTASQPARFEAADTGILEMTVQNAHVDVLQKFLTKFGA